MDQKSADASSESRVLIVGVDHELQDPAVHMSCSGNLPEIEAQDKVRFRDFLRSLVRDRVALFIGEEYLPPINTIACEVAAELGVRYECVDMPRDERERRGIPENYSTDQKLQPERKAAYHREREEYMVERTEELAPDIGSRIVVCGLDHLAGLRELFFVRCYAVESINVEELPEFDLGWLARRFWS